MQVVLPRLIGITGPAGAGKDTLADVFVSRFNYERYALASPLKKMLCAMLDVPMSAWDDRDWKETPHPRVGMSPRRMAQTLGTEWGRNILGKHVWTRMMIGEYQSVRLKSPTSGMVVTDVRFDSEAEVIREHGGIIIRVNRKGIGEVEPHESERGVHPSLWDLELDNDGSVEELQNRAVLRLDRQAFGVETTVEYIKLDVPMSLNATTPADWNRL